jgi:hypothetical protein
MALGRSILHHFRQTRTNLPLHPGSAFRHLEHTLPRRFRPLQLSRYMVICRMRLPELAQAHLNS